MKQHYSAEHMYIRAHVHRIRGLIGRNEERVARKELKGETRASLTGS